MPFSLTKVPLIVDPDKDFLRSLIVDESAATAPPFLANEIEEATNILEFNFEAISCIVINPAIGTEGVSSLLTASLTYLFGVPIYFICEPLQSRAQTELRVIKTEQILEKPMTYSTLLKCIEDLTAAGNLKIISDEVKERLRTTRLSALDDEFTSIRAQNLPTDSSVVVNVYVRLRENRYVCIVRAGRILDSARLERYRSRGLKEFHFRKSEAESYVKTCENLTVMLGPAA